MRKIKLQVQISIDGFIGGANGEMSWLRLSWSDDIQEYVENLTRSVDTIILGRRLAEGFIPHWAAVAGDANNPEQQAGIAFTEKKKIVFSKTLSESPWENTAIENGDYAEAIQKLKQQPGGDIIAYGGAQFVSSLIQAQLIDELHLFVNPAILGKGMPIFSRVQTTQQLQAVSAKRFECGIMLLVYKSL